MITPGVTSARNHERTEGRPRRSSRVPVPPQGAGGEAAPKGGGGSDPRLLRHRPPRRRARARRLVARVPLQTKPVLFVEAEGNLRRAGAQTDPAAGREHVLLRRCRLAPHLGDSISSADRGEAQH